MAPRVEFYYDIVSPYSYLAATQVETLSQALSCEFVWRPILLGGLFKLIEVSPPVTQEAKRRYIFEQDLPRMAHEFQVPLVLPNRFPINTIQALRAIVSFPEALWAEKSLALFEAYWGEGLDITHVEVLKEVLGAEIADAITQETVKARINQFTQEAADKGVFGAPSFLCADGQLFFGCDRLAQLKHHLTAQPA